MNRPQPSHQGANTGGQGVRTPLSILGDIFSLKLLPIPTPMLAVLRLTCRSAIRSHVFQFLLVILLASVFLVPNTIKGDGTAYGFIQISLEYSLAFIALILSMSSIWIGAAAMSLDVESSQLHLIVVKPISRFTVWTGKFLGVALIHLLLLAISAAAVYGFVMLQFKWQKFKPQEVEKVKNEILTGRRIFMPDLPDIDKMARDAFERKRAEALASNKPFRELSGPDLRKALADIRKEVVASLGEVKPGSENMKAWTYSGLPNKVEGAVSLRYKVFANGVETKERKESYGIWCALCYTEDKSEQDSSVSTAPRKPQEKKFKEAFLSRTDYPEPIQCSAPHEFELPGDIMVHDGKASISFINFDPGRSNLYFQVADGPMLYIKETGFLDNYIRGISVIGIQILVLAGISCAIGSMFSMPVAVFMIISYITLASFAAYLIGAAPTFYAESEPTEFLEIFGLYASNVLMFSMIPLQDFGISDKIANGELIELASLAGLIFKSFILKAMPLLSLGAWIYWRKELGLASKR